MYSNHIIDRHGLEDPVILFFVWLNSNECVTCYMYNNNSNNTNPLKTFFNINFEMTIFGYSKPKYSYIIVENICCVSGSLMLFIYSTQTFILIDFTCDRKYYIITNYLIHFFIQFNQMFPWNMKFLILETLFHWLNITLVFLITSYLSCVRLSLRLSVCL